ncbi:hypothetical protein CAPTEDRAFT_193378 [Capitella teleta]|uniref:Mab-21-like nucleotidyltransferase domain-containing protein n=1 Tax=Capitella teleta TaxID=283909 RepID=R7TB44_CAPTE|nr:hypothetical protein CAPTEDRAFT_193378 [Capitella teleta]|eukprot:ELT90722.1 hypothetical protein CAPTEDRAFT_193378 [Capitella teleta]
MLTPDDLVTDYYRQTQILVELILSNEHFSGHVEGMAFDEAPVCFSLGSTEDDASLEQHFASAPQPTGKQTVICLHEASIVLVDQSVEFKEGYPLVLYIREASRPGAVHVWMSSRTRGLILKEDYGMDLASAVEIREDDGVPRFHLMPQVLKKGLTKRALDKLLLVNPLVDMELCFETTSLAFNYARDISEVTEYLRSVYSLRMLPGLIMSEWPQKALSWTSRQKKWPKPEIISQVIKCPVMVIPFDQEDLWTYNFSSAEKCLLSHVDPDKMKILLNAQVLLYQMSDPNISWHRILKQVFLWFLGGSNGEDLNAFLKLFRKYLEDNFLPSYFLDELNLLDRINDEEISEILTTVEAALVMEDNQREVLLANYTAANTCDVVPLLKNHLQRCFERQVGLLYLQLYHQLHFGDLDKSISMHKGMIKRVRESTISDDTSGPLIELINNSLGSLFMVKAGHIKAKQNKKEMGKRAQDLLVQSLNMDLLSGRVKLAMYHFYKNEYEAVLDLLEEVPMSTCSTVDVWSRWKQKQYLFDVIISDHERPFLPADICACWGLMVSQVLGFVHCNVAIIDSCLFARYLKIMSMVELKKVSSKEEVRDDLKAMLRKAEDDEADMNERRNAAYLNILAEVYSALDEDSATEGLLQKSVTLVANPRNPARWKLFKLKTRKWRKMLTWGAGCLLLSTLAAAAVKVTRAHTQLGVTNIP